MTAALDHLVVAAATLDDGVRWCEATLGVQPAGGGRHALMGTHNRLLQLSSPQFERCYLEVIAIDPDAPAPGRARWFGLDEPALQARLAAAGPRLIHAVVRSTMLDMHRRALVDLGFNPGLPLAMERNGLRWQVLVRDDGRLDALGGLPTLIAWDGAHPAESLPASGVALRSLRLDGLPAAVLTLLRLRGVDGDPAAAPALQALLDTPIGPSTLLP